MDIQAGIAANMTSTADFSQRFTDLIADMKMDGRYRTFIQLERLAGEFPTALWHRPAARAGS
jgi:5-aminolevulinate synthase